VLEERRPCLLHQRSVSACWACWKDNWEQITKAPHGCSITPRESWSLNCTYTVDNIQVLIARLTMTLSNAVVSELSWSYVAQFPHSSGPSLMWINILCIFEVSFYFLRFGTSWKLVSYPTAISSGFRVEYVDGADFLFVQTTMLNYTPSTRRWYTWICKRNYYVYRSQCY